MRSSRSRRSRSLEPLLLWGQVETCPPRQNWMVDVIATHANTDFDAFASMLAARRLYPEAVVCLAGSLNRNVREFYRLHADELAAVDVSRLELDAIRRLIVVETTHASRLGGLERVALDPAVEKGGFDHHPGEPPDRSAPGNAGPSGDGALATTPLRAPA